jgi:methyltransferase (TIGR00027 family)
MGAESKADTYTISDTANWVAYHRAVESARPDAVFKDPLAERLAGQTGKDIVGRAPKPLKSGWPVIARTVAIDDMVRMAVAEGCDCVLNLAAGLDTRPYRLELPAALPWIEADLPGMIAAKERLLAGETPRCALQRVAVDLADAAARAAFLERATTGRRRVLVISEGLLMYLDEATVRALSDDLKRRIVSWWVFDAISPAVRDLFMKEMATILARAPMHFAPENGVAFFEGLGWRVREVRSAAQDAYRLRRLPWPMNLVMMLPLPQPNPRRLGTARWGGVVCLELATGPKAR